MDESLNPHDSCECMRAGGAIRRDSNPQPGGVSPEAYRYSAPRRPVLSIPLVSTSLRVLQTFGVVADAGNAGVSPSELVDGMLGAAASAGGVSGIVGVVVEVPVVSS